MTDSVEQSRVPGASPERRLRYRRPSSSFAYVEMGEDNGGVILNLSEGGLALQTVVALTDAHLFRLRFQLSSACDWVNASGRIVWHGESKEGGRHSVSQSARICASQNQELDCFGRFRSGMLAEKQAAVRESSKQIPESPSRRDLEAMQKGALEDARKKEDFWAPYPPGIHSGVPRESSPAKLRANAYPLGHPESSGPAEVRRTGKRNVPGESRNGWQITVVLVSFVAAISLAVGISIGNGSLHRWLWKDQNLIQSAREQARTIGSAAAYMILGGTSSPSPNAQRRVGECSVGRFSAITPDDSFEASTSPAIGRIARDDAGDTQPRYDTANLLTLPADQSQSGIWISEAPARPGNHLHA